MNIVGRDAGQDKKDKGFFIIHQQEYHRTPARGVMSMHSGGRSTCLVLERADEGQTRNMGRLPGIRQTPTLFHLRGPAHENSVASAVQGRPDPSFGQIDGIGWNAITRPVIA